MTSAAIVALPNAASPAAVIAALRVVMGFLDSSQVNLRELRGPRNGVSANGGQIPANDGRRWVIGAVNSPIEGIDWPLAAASASNRRSEFDRAEQAYGVDAGADYRLGMASSVDLSVFSTSARDFSSTSCTINRMRCRARGGPSPVVAGAAEVNGELQRDRLVHSA